MYQSAGPEFVFEALKTDVDGAEGLFALAIYCFIYENHYM